jgi:hypothetical protein
MGSGGEDEKREMWGRERKVDLPAVSGWVMTAGGGIIVIEKLYFIIRSRVDSGTAFLSGSSAGEGPAVHPARLFG